MKQRRHRNARLLVVSVFLAGGCFLLPQDSKAQQQPSATCADWTNVQSWSGTITISGSGHSSDQHGNSSTTSESATITFKTSTTPGGPCDPFVVDTSEAFTWLEQASQVTDSVTIHDTVTSPCVGSDGGTYTQTTSYDVDNGTTTLNNAGLAIIFTSATSGGYGLGWSEYVDGLRISYSSTGCGTAPPTISNNVPWGPVGIILNTKSIDYFPNPVPLPSTISTLNCNSGGSTAGVSFRGASYLGASAADWTIGCNIVPAFAYDVLVSTIQDYPKWRPMGGADEKAVGNLLDLQARIVYKGTTQTAFGVNPDQWMFTLKDYSSEPGVALNWPPQDQLVSPTPPDLDFNLAVNNVLNPGIVIPPPGTTAQIPLNATNAGNLAFVQLTVESHDWGGWATLNVAATVAGQPPIQGHLTLPGLQNVTDILLPLRIPGSHIANSWKNGKVPLNTADSDDSEIPQGANNSNRGDGLTLYEEYRGFYVDCAPIPQSSNCFGSPSSVPPRAFMHVEGDPTKLDLFVVNDGEPDVLEGMKDFAAGTGIKVCCPTLRDDQINGQASRVVNFNHSQGAHEVDQHAIVIVKGKGAGPCTEHGPDQPKNITKIYYPPIANILDMAQREGGSARVAWATDKYPYSVAHELGHSVNVSHHGVTDSREPRYWTTPDGTSLIEINPDGTSTPIQAFLEDNSTTVTPSDLSISAGGKFKIYRGENGGKHSGDVFCFMRYNISQSYLPLADPNGNKRFFVPERERAGRRMTNMSVGTDTNDPNRTTPQPRYGNSDGVNHFGMCLSQICVNDRLTPMHVTPPDTNPCLGQSSGQTTP